MNRPFYSLKPIHSLSALALALGVAETTLSTVAKDAASRYRLAKPIQKPDGSIRRPFDALEPLKGIHRRIKDRILSRVSFPYYLTGSLKGQDYRKNAALHAGARISICEDIEGFFPATSSDVVHDVWRHFFGFGEEVADVLTTLTTKDGSLPQGAITSSYLANLAFWRLEPELHDRMQEAGIQYSRYVDDITASAKRFLNSTEQRDLIAAIYGMLRKQGYRAKRRKHDIFTSGGRMFTTKLMTNRRPALALKERAQIRAAVFQLERRVAAGEAGATVRAELASVTGRVAKLKAFHGARGRALMERVGRMRAQLSATAASS